MTGDPLLKRFDAMSVWRQGDQRAPHKPLLVLYALGRWQRGLAEVTFREAEPALTALLREFGPPRRSDHPEQPFWRLQRDGARAVRSEGVRLGCSDTIFHLPERYVDNQSGQVCDSVGQFGGL
jgi:putative restriction endonuclease